MSQPPGKEGVSKKASKKMDPVEKCKRANPNDNAFCSMPDWKTCAPKDNTKRKDCSKLDDCEGKEGGKMKQQSARKLLGSVSNLLHFIKIIQEHNAHVDRHTETWFHGYVCLESLFNRTTLKQTRICSHTSRCI